MTVPYRYQLEDARAIHRFGGRCLVASEMGVGKSYISLLYAQLHPEARPFVVVCPASLKFQWELECKKHFGWRAEVLEGRTPCLPSFARHPILILNYDIVTGWLEYLREIKPQLVIVDECFTEDTKVLTAEGCIPIGKIVKEKMPVKVACLNHGTGLVEYRSILRHFKTERKERLVTVHHRYGSFSCTENHKIWTENRGYVKAKNLVHHDQLQMLQKENFSQNKEENAEILLKRMRSPMAEKPSRVAQEIHQRVRNEDQYSQKEICPDGERQTGLPRAKQPAEGKEAQPGDHRENTTTLVQSGASSQSRCRQSEEGHTPPVERQKRRQRPADSTTREDLRDTTIKNRWLEERAQHPYPPATSTLPIQIHGGYRQQNFEDCCGDRRSRTPNPKETGEGREERKSTASTWVDRIEIHQPAGRSEPGRSSADHSFVYCLEIEENHNFFAEGILVSNCGSYLGNPGTQRTKAIRKLCTEVPQVIALSGTPLVNRPAELWPTLNILRPDLFKSFWPFGMHFCGPRRIPFGSGWDFRGASHLDELHALLFKELVIRRRKVDVLKDLPGKQRHVVPLALTNPKEYEHAHNQFLDWLRKRDPGKVSAALRAEQLVRLGTLKQLAARLKLPFVFEWVDSFLKETDEKLVMFGIHREILGQLHRRYQKICVLIDGQVSSKDRQLAVEKFQTHANTRLFLGNIKAAGVGLNLTAASTVAFCECDWTPGAHVQGEDRAHRIGTTNQVSVYYLVAHGTIEEYLAQIIQEKQRVLSAVLDGGNGEDLNVFEQLTEALQRGTADVHR